MVLCSPRKMSKQETELEECGSSKTPTEIRQLLASDDKIAPLIIETAQQAPQLPSLQAPKQRHGLRPFPHLRPQFHPVDSFQGIQAPFHCSYSWPQFHPSGVSRKFQAALRFPHLQPQFHLGGISHEFQAPFPLPNSKPQFCLSSTCHEFQAPLPLNVQIGPLHPGLPQLHPSGSFHGIHAPFAPIGPTGAFQRPSPEFTGSGELMLDKEIRELLFLLRPPSLPIESLANVYIDRYGKPLRIEGFLTEGQQHGKIGCSLTDVLMRLNTTRVIERHEQQYIVPVEDAPMYLAHGFKLGVPPATSDPYQIYVTFSLGSKFTGEDVRNYFSQYGTVNDVRIPPHGRRAYGFGFVSFQDPRTAKLVLSERTPHVICGDQVYVKEYKDRYELERQPHYTVPVEDAPKYLAHGFKLGMPPASSYPYQIYVTFGLGSKFTEEDVRNYFSQYGTVNDVRIPPHGRRTYGYGFVSFQNPRMAKQILSEGTRHFICGDQVYVKEYQNRQEPERQSHYIVPVEDTPKYLAHGSKLEVPSARSNPSKIYVVFVPESKFTEEDVRNYFSLYGTVNNVWIPPQGRRMYGFVSFQDTRTAERILSERTPHFICGDQVHVKAYKEKCELQRGQNHGFKLMMPSSINSYNQIFITFNPKSTFTENDAWNYFSHYGPVNNVRIPLEKKRMFGYVSFKYPETVKQILSERSSRTSHFICGDHVFVEPYSEKYGPETLAREGAHSIPGPHEVSDLSVTHEHHIHTGEQLSSDHGLFGEKLNEVCDQGIVSEKSSTDVAQVMVLPPTHNLYVHSVSETSPSQGDNTAESSHVPNRLDEASANHDSNDLRLPETLDDVY